MGLQYSSDTDSHSQPAAQLQLIADTRHGTLHSRHSTLTILSYIMLNKRRNPLPHRVPT